MRVLAGFFLIAACTGRPDAAGDMDGYARGLIETPAEQARRLAERDNYAGQRRAYEIETEQSTRPTALRSGCDAPIAAGTPWLCVRLAGPGGLAKGVGELRYRVEWRNLPAQAGLIVALERAAPVGERWRYLGALGPLQLSTLPIAGDGARDFVWNGRELGCAPADLPMWCREVEIGAYRLSGVVVDRPDLAILGWPDRRPFALLAWARSRDFRIDGDFDMRSILRLDRGETATYLERRLGMRGALPDNILDAPLPARPQGQGYCAGSPLRPPLRGTLRICLPDRVFEPAGVAAEPADLRFGGDIDYLPGLVRQDLAEAIARRVAMRGYERAADYVGYPGLDEARRGGGGDERNNPRTWLDTNMGERHYRSEAGGYWLFVVNQMVKNFRGDGRAGRYDRLLVKVEPNGTACLVGQGPMESYNPSIRADAPPGGMTREQARPFFDPERWNRPCPRRG